MSSFRNSTNLEIKQTKDNKWEVLDQDTKKYLVFNSPSLSSAAYAIYWGSLSPEEQKEIINSLDYILKGGL